mmetsp:Transcript_42066/g.75264  ORF Transcript_42066/g.75264 Transcript_42066/m.75264 type:complete len:224 (+) Transcript_42066:218-889(+)
MDTRTGFLRSPLTFGCTFPVAGAKDHRHKGTGKQQHGFQKACVVTLMILHLVRVPTLREIALAGVATRTPELAYGIADQMALGGAHSSWAINVLKECVVPVNLGYKVSVGPDIDRSSHLCSISLKDKPAEVRPRCGECDCRGTGVCANSTCNASTQGVTGDHETSPSLVLIFLLHIFNQFYSLVQYFILQISHERQAHMIQKKSDQCVGHVVKYVYHLTHESK